MLFKVKFFDPCLDHQSRSKERSLFCLYCCDSFCILCTNNHSGHRILQIQKYNSRAAVRTEDLDTLINCSLVQHYTLSTTNVFFVKTKPAKEEVAVEEGVQYVSQADKWTTPRRCPFEIFSRSCSYCSCSLKEEFKYCSLLCKVNKLLRTEGSILRQLRYRSNLLPPSNPVSSSEQFSAEPNTRALTIGKPTRLRQLRYRSNLSPPSNPISRSEQFSAEANTRTLTIGQSTQLRQLRYRSNLSPPSNSVSISNGEQFSAEPNIRALTVGKSTHSMQNDTEICEFARKKREKNGVASSSGSVVMRRRKGVPHRSPSNLVSSGEQFSAEPNTRALAIGQSTQGPHYWEINSLHGE